MTATEAPAAEPVEPGDWIHGSRTVAQAERDTGLSRDTLWALMREGAVRSKVHSGRKTRLICWLDLARYIAALPDPEVKED